MALSVEIMAAKALPQSNTATTSMRQDVRDLSEGQRIIFSFRGIRAMHWRSDSLLRWILAPLG